ncbi:hypothetical protein T8K17_01945 [Thalassobaculum sp. OXR-137]|uniref:hypothetical protein n=1 Tax=Thalassobaculum sp. OXR-137 TaxID=3100173 RepID=UPI002AC956BB|nr:hypothetical protein [Thalassobaculum sp. OXR-137]WPZ33193.1 hypothetical protein T8K17_18365 [Thalassobaculum sp. OXR-137]WPZ34913.1 hypothetical protein T8K17_01945 [Thalassobaculum sp. OXR-137]
MATDDGLLISNFLMSTAAIRVLVRSGVLDKEALLAEIEVLRSHLSDAEDLGESVDAALEGIRNMPGPSG